MRVCGDYGLHFTQNLSVGELPSLNANVPTAAGTLSNVEPLQRWSCTAVCVPNNDAYSGQFITVTINGTSNQSHNNISPAIAVYTWRRIS